MGVSNKQIGWSVESNLIWNALKELDKLNKVTGSSMSSIVASLATKITNEQGVPSFYSDSLVNIPPAGTVGRMFVSTDTFALYRDNGIGWDLIGGPGTGAITGSGTAGQVSFWNGTSTQTGSVDFTWNNTAKVLAFSNGGILTNEIRVSSINTNTFFGRNAGIANNTGNINTFIGANAGFSNTSGSNNTLIGSSTGFNNLTAGSLVCVGVNAGFNLTTGDSNIFIGRESGRWIADGVTSLTTSSTSILIGRGSRVNANGEFNQIAIGNNAIGLGSNTTVIGNSSTTFGRWWGNLLIGTSVNSVFALDVSGTTRLNGLQTFQGTTASDTAPLGSELATTGSGTNWTGTAFSTGYTHVVGSTASLTTSIPAVNGTYYQIAYTITGRTAGSITINYGGTSTSGITATGATGPLATSTANLEIVPTSDFNGTVVLSVRSIGTSSATTTFNDSSGNARIQIRATSSTNNTIVGLNSGTRITTAISNSFYGQSAGNNTTTGNSNSFFGRESGFSNTIGISNSFYGSNSGFSNISGSANSFFGTSSGTNNTGNSNSFFGASSGNANTTASSNSFFGVNSGFNNTTGSNNTFIGLDAGRRISGGGNLTVSTNSVFVGVDTRANADNEQNQIAIGHTAIGLGSNTTVIGNSSTTFGRWWGNLLIGTSTNSTFALDVAGTARVTPPANSTALTLSGYSLTGANEQPAIDISGTWNTTGTPTLILANVTNTASNASSRLIDLQVGTVSRFRVLANGYVNFGTSVRVYPSSSTSSGDVDINGEFLTLNSRTTSSETGASVGFVYLNGPSASATSGIQNAFLVSKSFTPTSGNASYNSIISQTGINQTGGANGITRGLYVNPTLTSAADWRSIEWSNSTGRGLWGTGTANNAMAGALHVGSATNANAAAILEITSTTRGVLFPRMTSAQRNAIATPPAGLVVYNTTDNRLSVFNGTGWVNIDTL